jgi:hypothetical protein
VPNRFACVVARAAKSAPLIPRGKPMKFSIKELMPACPPVASRSIRAILNPSDEP